MHSAGKISIFLAFQWRAVECMRVSSLKNLPVYSSNMISFIIDMSWNHFQNVQARKN
jgi:hypothetical protein